MDTVQRDVTVLLRGGLGNQLFQYFAGQLVAQATAGQLVLDTSESSLTHDRVGITAFHHRGRERVVLRPTLGLSPAVDLRYLAWRESRAGDVALSRITDMNSIIEITRAASACPLVLDGFFASPEIPAECRDRGIALVMDLRKPSRWYEELFSQVDTVDPVMIHVRRGDYRQNSQWGLLGADYYRDALEAVGYDWQRQIWVFSDEPATALELIGEVVPSQNLTPIVPPRRSPAAESLVLMSRASTLITANSTMSWWAAQMGGMVVAAPVPFHPLRSADSGLTPLSPGPTFQNWFNVPVSWP